MFTLAHLCSPSFYPFMTGVCASLICTSILLWFSTSFVYPLVYSLFHLAFLLYCWWSDVICEADVGHHTYLVQDCLKFGMALFIFSEAMFFVAFFWALFDASLSPEVFTGCVWVPFGMKPVPAFGIPLLNTVILLTSGLTVTVAHYRVLANDVSHTFLFYTVLLGIYFTFLQWFEYQSTDFTISDSIYGTVFFVTTGFHGIHVVVGTIFLSVMCYRAYTCKFSCTHHVGLDCCVWYWHFVDVVWLFLYFSLYIWAR